METIILRCLDCEAMGEREPLFVWTTEQYPERENPSMVHAAAQHRVATGHDNIYVERSRDAT